MTEPELSTTSVDGLDLVGVTVAKRLAPGIYAVEIPPGVEPGDIVVIELTNRHDPDTDR